MSGYNIYEIGNSANSQQQPQDTGTERLNQLNERLASAYDCNQASRRAQEPFITPPPPSHQYNHHPFDAINNSLNPHRQRMNSRQMAPNNNQHESQATPVDLGHPQIQTPVFNIQQPFGGAPINLDQSLQFPAYHTNDSEYTANPQMLAQNQIEGSLINNDQQLSQLPFHHEHTINPQMLSIDPVVGTSINFPQSPQLPVDHMDNGESTVNPQMLAHNQFEGPLINNDQQLSQLPIHNQYTMNPQILAHHQIEGTSINYGQQSQSTNYTDSVGYLDNPQMLAQNQAEGTSINHGQQPQLLINGNQHQALDFSHDFGHQQTQIQGHHTSDIGNRLGQQASIDCPFQNGSINFDQPLSIPVYATDDNRHDISQRVPAHFQVGGTSAHCGQQLPQMPVNQTNFNGVNNNQQATQAIPTTSMSSFAKLSAEDQNAEFRHFCQQRLMQGDTEGMEFAIFKSWYTGQQLKGNSKPTLEYGVTPLHQTLRFDSNLPKQQPMIPLNNQEHIQPPTMTYQGTGREFTTGFQYTMGPSPTLSGQAMRPNNEQYLQNPRKSTESSIPARRASKAVASAGQPLLPISLPSMVQPALPSTTRAQAPTPLATAMPALPPTTRAQPPQSATTMPAVTRRGRKLQIGDPQQLSIVTRAKGKKVSREQKNGTTSAAQPTIVRVDQIRSLPGKYTISLSNLPEVDNYEETFDEDLFHTLDAEIQVIDTKILKGTDKVYMLRNNDSRTMVEMALRAILQNSIARLSVNNLSDARQSFENYLAIKNIGNSLEKSLAFAPESQFVEEKIKVVGGTKQTVRLAKNDVPAYATHMFMCDTIECDLNGIEVKGNYSLYTKTTFTNATTPLKYAIGLKIQVAEIGNHRARSGLLTYERPLPSNVVGEPHWADILDLFELQAAEWDVNTRIQGPPTSQTSTSNSLSDQQKNDTKESSAEESDIEQQLPFLRPVHRQRAQAGQPLTPEQQTGRGDKRKRQQKPEPHASPVIFTSNSEDSSPLSNSSSQISNATTGKTSVSPRPVAASSRLSDNSRPLKRSRNGYGMESLKRGTSMMSASSSIRQPPMNRISHNDHMHPARPPSEGVRLPIATATQNLMPAQVSAQDCRLHAVDGMEFYKQSMKRANDPRPYEYPASESAQPSRTLSTRSDMPTQMQAQLLRTPTEAELAPHREQVLSVWKSSFPIEKKSS